VQLLVDEILLESPYQVVFARRRPLTEGVCHRQWGAHGPR
jgi:hypothetical protein